MDKLLILGIFLSGGDRLGIKIGNNTFKVVQLLFFIYFLYVIITKKYRVNKTIFKIWFPIILTHFISLFSTKSFCDTLFYFIYIVFDYIVVVGSLYTWGKRKKNSEIINIYINILRIVSFLIIIQFILGNMGIRFPLILNDVYKGIYRPALWFYEPSFLILQLGFYYILSLNYFMTKIKYNKYDLFLSSIAICATTSSTGYIMLLIGLIIFMFCLCKNLNQIFKYTISIIIFLLIAILIVYFYNKNILLVFIGRMFQKNGLIVSSGGRIESVIETWNVAKQYLVFGVGADAYKTYIGYEPNGIFVEIIATLGLVGFSCFSIFFILLVKEYKKYKDSIEIKGMFYGLILILIILQIKRGYVRPYMCIHIGLLLVMISNMNKKIRRNKKCKQTILNG